MPRSKVSDEQREKIVALRQKGGKWTEIKEVTGVDRRTAKNVYEKWERSSSIEKLQKVRKEVAAVEFRTHMESVVKLAESLISNLDVVPRSIDDMKMNGEDFLKWLWGQDILQRYSSSNRQLDNYTPGDSLSFRIRDPRIYLDEKKLLFKSLRNHTRGEVQWNILDNDWKNARDKCAENVPHLLKDTSQLINNYFKNSNDPKFLEKVKRTTKENNPVKNMTRAIVQGIWHFIISNQLKEKPLFETVSKGGDIAIVLKFRGGTSGIFMLSGTDGQYVAENITKICNSATIILGETNTVRDLRNEVDNIRKASDTLREMLNPLKLHPMILLTRCELCPV